MFILLRLFLFSLITLLSTATLAVCPLCAFTVGAGIGLTQYCGIDDSISGIWIGGFIISLVILTNNWLINKKWDFVGFKVFSVFFYYISFMLPLYYMGYIGHELNKLWGMDRIVLGIFVGSITVWISSITYKKLKEFNNNHAHFPFQKVVIPVVFMTFLSFIFYFITK